MPHVSRRHHEAKKLPRTRRFYHPNLGLSRKAEENKEKLGKLTEIFSIQILLYCTEPVEVLQYIIVRLNGKFQGVLGFNIGGEK
jgi:hypothetical protein